MADNVLLEQDEVNSEARKFIANVYKWMAIALVVSGLSALLTATTPSVTNLVLGSKVRFTGFIILEVAMVFILSAAIRKLSVTAATIFFLLYAVVNGITLSAIFLVFDIGSIGRVFFISAAMFAAMAIYGVKTSQNLQAAGRYLAMAVIGLIIASIVNLLFKSGVVEWIISLVSVVVFIGLTAYDSQKMLIASKKADGSDVFKKAAILGALELYLDFINIFLSLLNLFGKRRS